jgi:cysteine-rich repeat protein
MNHTKKQIVTINSKKGVSIMIGYVLLVSFAIIIGGILYNWMKTYVPKEALDCPDGVSIFVEEVICQGGNLNLTLKNNGRFDIAGYFIHATDEVGQKLATLDLSEYIIGGGTLRLNSIVFDLDENAMEPAETKKSIFNLPKNINSIDIIPIRFQVEDNKQRFVSCGNAKIREIVNCDGSIPEIQESCGNGTIDTGEECDDNNTVDGEGCSSTCTIETGWTCVGEPSVCTEIPGETQIIQINYSGFESDIQGWTDTGADSDRSSVMSSVQDDGTSGGSRSFHIQDNTASSITRQNFNFTGYKNITIKWWGHYIALENNDCVELKIDGTKVDSWGNDADTSNCDNNIAQNTWLAQSITITNDTYNFDDSVEVSFEGEMTGNSQEFYVDGINITGIL